MIPYELAKQLRDAGFPQNSEDTISEYLPDSPIPYYERSVSNPSLSELIEVCGNGFDILKRDLENMWIAESGPDDFYGADYRSEGSTPDEAVAKLYLAINKK